MGFASGLLTLDRRIAAGAMGEVWRASHADGTDVAVKVLTEDVAQRASFRRAFEAEVRAVAALDHPGVVTVFDRGVTGDGEPFPTGSPYLVMELGFRTLAQIRVPLPWTDARALLLEILAALAHAHSRRVVHRDLKPSNVLVMDDGALRLSDFGLAHAFDADLAALAEWAPTAGTPAYMAPEQVDGRWREFGPWTDLYALGCLAWTLAGGAPPFEGLSPRAVLDAQRSVPAPPLPKGRGPEGLPAWVARLLDKRIEARFQTAADAARELEALDEVERRPTYRSRPTTTWRRAPVTRPATPAGLGLGLFGHRPPPLAGRQVERDVLWDALDGVCASGEPRAVVLRGAAGHGKSRLASWIGERAEELGVAAALEARHGPTAGPQDGLTAMAASAVRAAGLSGEELQEHVAAWVARRGRPATRAEVARLVALVSGDQEALHDPTARRAALVQLLARIASARPLVLVLDDVQWAPEAIDVAEAILRVGVLPALVVLTAREEALPAELGARLDRLPRSRTLHLAPLGREAMDDLAGSMLGLEPALAREVSARTGGNPLFAVQLVGDWVERGVLERGPDGFRRPEGSSATLPDGLHAIWVARLAHALGDDPAAAEAVEIAATLGNQVDLREWALASGRSREEVLELGARLAGSTLAVVDEQGLAFVHGMLAESLLRTARERGRGEAHHLAVADALETLSVPPERQGVHRLRAGQPERALDLLVRGAQRLQIRYRRAECREALALGFEAADAAGVPASDPRRGQLRLVCAVLELDGDVRRGCELAEALLEEAERHGWSDLVPDALRVIGATRATLGHSDVGRRHLERAVELGAARSTWPGRGPALIDLGQCHAHAGDHAEALRFYAQAADEARRTDDPHLAASSTVCMGNASLGLDRMDDAVTHARRAIEIGEPVDAQRSVLGAFNLLGEVARARGDLAAARRFYDRVLAGVRGTGSSLELTARSNLGMLSVEHGDYAAGAIELAAVRAALVDLGVFSLAGELLPALLAASAGERRFRRFDALAAELERETATRSFGIDAGPMLRLAGDLARGMEPARAARAYRLCALALDQEGDARGAAALRATADSLTS